jgi:hypothetical protein
MEGCGLEGAEGVHLRCAKSNDLKAHFLRPLNVGKSVRPSVGNRIW